jgi:glycosyltransferase involved in cell wall biosynthesis
MKIIFTRFPLESALGGAEIQTLSLMEGLLARGHAVAFAGSCPVLLAECRKRHIPVVELDIGPPPVTKYGVFSFAWRKARMRAKLKAVFASFENSKFETRNSRLDVIVMLSLSEKLLLTDIAADAGTKVIWVEHDRIGRWLTQNPWLQLLLKQSKKATTVCVSELSRKMYEEMGWDNKKIFAIPNGIEGRARGREVLSHKKNSQFSILNSQFRLGCIARLSKEKGVDVLINAMVDVPAHITLEIIGTGREEQALKHLVRSLKLEDRVIFTQHESDVTAAYARWDTLILPSRDHDPFGMVAAEAMLAGLPVIVTDQCGIAGYVNNDSDAIIVEADSASALSEAIGRIQNSEFRIQIAHAGQKTAEKKFSTKTMVERYEDVFTGTSSRD